MRTVSIAAYDLANLAVQDRSQAETPAYRRSDQYPDKLKGELPLLWRLDSTHEVHIKARQSPIHRRSRRSGGDRVACGGENNRMSSGRRRSWERRIAWWRPTTGCLSSPKRAASIVSARTSPSRSSITGLPRLLRPFRKTKQNAPPGCSNRLLKRKATPWCWESRIRKSVVELVRQSQLYVIAVDADQQKVSALRDRLHRAGWYATRATAHVGDPLAFPFPPYVANLVVVDLAAADGESNRALRAAYRTLRPYGGTASFAVSAGSRDQFVKQVETVKLVGADVAKAENEILVRREGPLPGAADWSHEEANAANAGASPDRFLRAPLDMLWFDGSLRWHRKPGSAVVRVARGRIFVLAEKLYALDVYTGRRLWETEVPEARSATSEMVAASDAVYLTTGKTCLAFDPATGKSTAKHELAGGPSTAWGNIHVEGDYLVGQNGKQVVCFNRRSGKQLWQFTCARSDLSIALGSGKVFCAEVLNRRRGETAESGAKTRALDLATGEVLWQFAGGSLTRYSADHDLVILR